MPQLACPAYDIGTGSWTPLPLWRQISEHDLLAAADDARYIESAAGPEDDNCEVGLARVVDPEGGRLPVLVPGSGRRVLR